MGTFITILHDKPRVSLLNGGRNKGASSPQMARDALAGTAPLQMFCPKISLWAWNSHNSQAGRGPENLLCTTLHADKRGGLGCLFKIEPKMEGAVVPETPLGRELLFMNTHLILCLNWLKALHFRRDHRFRQYQQ